MAHQRAYVLPCDTVSYVLHSRGAASRGDVSLKALPASR